jgi:hypothetical protein
MNLAYMEMQVLTAGMFRKYDVYDGTGTQSCPTLELYETSRADVDLASDFAMPQVRVGSKGVRVRIREGRER